jgi:hypothetical protein
MSSTNTTDDVLFEEHQQFRQPWIWVLMFGVVLLVVGTFIVGVMMDPKKVADGAWIFPAIIFFLVYGSTALLIFIMRLTVRVDHYYLHVQFFPVLKKDIPLEEIEQFEARTYRPLVEYGGWGIRCGWKGWAYNVRGDRGVQLVLTNGKRILLGSQRAEELAAAIAEAKRR